MESRSYAFRNLNFDIGYDQQDLWNIVDGKKRFRIEIRKLDVESPSWSRMENDKEIFYSISEVYNNQEEYQNEVERTMRSNLNYPIVLVNCNEILDGNHRVLKAIILGHKSIYAKNITEEELKEVEIVM